MSVAVMAMVKREQWLRWGYEQMVGKNEMVVGRMRTRQWSVR
jgi:hypothetical protein